MDFGIRPGVEGGIAHTFVQLAPGRHATLCDSRRLDSDRSEAVAGWRVRPLWIAALHADHGPIFSFPLPLARPWSMRLSV